MQDPKTFAVLRTSASQYPKTLPVIQPLYLVPLQADDEQVTASGVTLTGHKTYTTTSLDVDRPWDFLTLTT